MPCLKYYARNIAQQISAALRPYMAGLSLFSADFADRTYFARNL